MKPRPIKTLHLTFLILNKKEQQIEKISTIPAPTTRTPKHGCNVHVKNFAAGVPLIFIKDAE